MDEDAPPRQVAAAAAEHQQAPVDATAHTHAQHGVAAAAVAAGAALPAVAHEGLDEEEAAARLIQPRDNALQIAARCMSKLPAVVRLALARAGGSDADFFLAAQAVSRIVGCYPHILPLLLRHFRTSKSLLALLEGAPSLPPHEAASGQMCAINILETALRLYDAAPENMLHMWEWTPVQPAPDAPRRSRTCCAQCAFPPHSCTLIC